MQIAKLMLLKLLWFLLSCKIFYGKQSRSNEHNSKSSGHVADLKNLYLSYESSRRVISYKTTRSSSENEEK